MGAPDKKSRSATFKPSYKFLVSACLAGINCTYKGRNNLKVPIKAMVARKEAITVCPEVLGGLGIPRGNAEISGGDGKDVLRRKAKVRTISGRDVSRNFIRGARATLRIAKAYRIRKAILKSNSPSCGYGRIYNGNFSQVLKNGCGVTAALLHADKIKIYTEKDNLHA